MSEKMRADFENWLCEEADVRDLGTTKAPDGEEVYTGTAWVPEDSPPFSTLHAIPIQMLWKAFRMGAASELVNEVIKITQSKEEPSND